MAAPKLKRSISLVAWWGRWSGVAPKVFRTVVIWEWKKGDFRPEREARRRPFSSGRSLMMAVGEGMREVRWATFCLVRERGELAGCLGVEGGVVMLVFERLSSFV